MGLGRGSTSHREDRGRIDALPVRGEWKRKTHPERRYPGRFAYNLQVRKLRQRFPDMRVGTVDKFQGQEAPFVILSMAASSAESAPRGVEFLFSKNRLNVAISRAQVLAIVVASPKLTLTKCAGVGQPVLSNRSDRRFAKFAANC